MPLELDDDKVHYVGNLNNFSASVFCMYFFNIARHHITFMFNANRPIYQVFFFWFWVKCDYSEAPHIEMQVHTSNSNTGPTGHSNVLH